MKSYTRVDAIFSLLKNTKYLHDKHVTRWEGQWRGHLLLNLHVTTAKDDS